MINGSLLPPDVCNPGIVFQPHFRRIPLELTYAGRVFLNYALHQQKALIAMRHEFSDITNNQKGKLRIGLAYSRSQSLMPNLITHFQKNGPIFRLFSMKIMT